MALFPVTFSDP